MSDFSDDELDRYARHLVLREVGGRGQALLKAASVAVVGAGGLGSPCLLYLAAAGVGRLTVIDDDDVALSNLQRQILFTTADGCDSFATRLAVSDAATALAIPLVSGAVGPFDGQIATFKGHDAALPCYRCLVGAAADREGQSCADTGVIGALTGVIGAMMALEVIREITGFGETLAGRLLLYDAMAARMRTVRLPKDPACRCAAVN